MDMFVVSRQTTESGTATDITKATGRDKEEALLNAKIKAYDLMKAFKNEATMISAFVGVSDLVGGFTVIENWHKAE